MSIQGVCVFHVGRERYGLDVRLVGEVVAVERLTRVPASDEGVLGIFNLRGLPVALLDLSRLLGLAVAHGAQPVREPIALVLQAPGGIVAAARVDKVAAVVQSEHTRPRAHERGSDHAAVLGLYETEAHGVVTVLDGAAVIAAVDRIKFRRGGATS